MSETVLLTTAHSEGRRYAQELRQKDASGSAVMPVAITQTEALIGNTRRLEFRNKYLREALRFALAQGLSNRPGWSWLRVDWICNSGRSANDSPRREP